MQNSTSPGSKGAPTRVLEVPPLEQLSTFRKPSVSALRGRGAECSAHFFRGDVCSFAFPAGIFNSIFGFFFQLYSALGFPWPDIINDYAVLTHNKLL